MTSLTLTRPSLQPRPETIETPYGEIDEPPLRKPPSIRARTIAAATGAAMTSLTMTPFDVIKTRLQTQSCMPSSSTSSRPLTPLFPYPPRPCAVCAPSSTPASCALAPASSSSAASTKNLASRFSSLALASVAGGRHTTASSASCTWEVGWVDQPPSRRGLGGAGGVRGGAGRVEGFFDGVVRIARTEGVGALWKGVGTTLLMSVPAQTLYMLTYSNLMLTLPPSALLTPLTSGILSRTLITTLFSPIELLRTRLQATPPPGVPHVTLSSTLHHLRESVAQQGPRTLWRGLAPSLWRDVPFSGIYWLLQHNITLLLAPSLPPYLLGAPLAFVSGFGAGSLASLVTNPFDVLKTRRQTASIAQETSTLRAIMQVAKEEGWQRLWTGVGPRTAKIAPACGVMIACYEGVARLVP